MTFKQKANLNDRQVEMMHLSLGQVAHLNPDVTLFPMSNENMLTLPTLNASMRNMHIS